MPPITVHPIDLAIVAVYLLIVFCVGLWFSRGVDSGHDLFLAGKSLPWWAVAGSLVVTDIGAKDMVGLADDGYRYGLVMTNFDLIGCVFPVLIAAFLFMPYFWMMGIYTIPEYLGRRYNQAVRTFFALCWGLFMIGTTATILVSAGVMFENLLGWNFWFSVIGTAIFVGIFTASGGLKAVVYTDFVSCIVLIAGTVLICYFGLVEVGGFEALQAKIASLPDTQHHMSLLRPSDDPKYPWPAVLLGLGFVMGPGYWIGNQAIVQRAFGTRTQNEARAAYIGCALIKLVFPFLLVVPGVIALALFHEKLSAGAWQGGRVLPMLLQLLPTGVMGIILGAFLAGVTSNLDSYVNSASTLWVTDIYKPFVNPNATDRDCLVVGRWLVVALLVLGIVTAYPVRSKFDSVYDAFQTFLSIFQGPTLALLLCGMLSKRITQWGGVAGMLAGIVTSVVMTFILHYAFLWVAWWSFVAALSSNILVSLLTTPYSEDRLRGLVYSLSSSEEAA